MRKLTAIGGLAFGLALALGPACEGQQPREGGAEKAGRKVDEALKGLGEKANSAAESVKQRFHRVKRGVQDMGVEARIYTRLHWDKALKDADIDLEVREGGVAVLSGSVADASAKAKAVGLARDTVGVDRVVDQLKVGATTTTTTETTTTTTTKKP